MPNDRVSLLVVVDVFSRWTTIGFLKDLNSRTIVEVFKRIWINKFDYPKILVSDQGTQFTANHFLDFCAENQIRHIPTSPYNPTANSPVERKNQEIVVTLRMCKDISLKEALERVSNRINYTASPQLGFSPFELLNHYSILDPLSRDLTAELETFSTRDPNMKQARESHRNNGRKNIISEHYQSAMIKAYGSNKLSPKYRGPFKILNFSDDGNQVTVKEENKETTYNIKNVFLRREGEDEIVPCPRNGTSQTDQLQLI